jgi:hypothetical protein
MSQATKDQRSRDRIREYHAQLDAAREVAGVLALFAQAREACSAGNALEVAFAAIPSGPDDSALPAAVWVALRHDDLDAVLTTLVEHATEQFVVAEHEQLDETYKLTTVEEARGLPDADRLIDQVAAFLDIPRDVLAIVCGWGREDPRTASEVERLITARYATTSRTNAPAALAMTSDELAAMLSLTPEQQAVLGTLVRQADLRVTR